MSCADFDNAVVPGSVALPGIPLTNFAVLVVGTPVAVPEIVSTTVAALEVGSCRTGKVLTLDNGEEGGIQGGQSDYMKFRPH